MKVPPQIKGLVILALMIVGVYCSARYILTPRSFGRFGHYRGDALSEAASHEPVYAGRQSCVECHAKQHETLTKFEHKTISCESCHGPSGSHVVDPKIKLIKLDDDGCMRCHEANPARPKFIKQFERGKHYSGNPCIECHSPHQPIEVQ